LVPKAKLSPLANVPLTSTPVPAPGLFCLPADGLHRNVRTFQFVLTGIRLIQAPCWGDVLNPDALPVLSENSIRAGFASQGRIIASLGAMISILHALGMFVVDLFKSRRRLEAENLLLRHQLGIAMRQAPPRLGLRGRDRALLLLVTRLWPSLLDAVQVVQPETVLRWHRAGFRAFWRWKSRKRAGRPKIDRGLRDLIRRMSMENPLWGASRIHGELLMLGFEVAQSTVSKYMARLPKPPSQSWKTVLRNHAEAIAAIDMCMVPTLTFERLFAFLVLGHGRRQLLWFEVTRHPTAEWLARQITEAFPWTLAPTYLVRDNDRAYGHVFTSRVRAMGIRDRPISPGSPWQNGCAERLIGTLRRECFDQMLVFDETHLRRVLSAYAAYYNQARTHLALGKDAPIHRAIQRSGDIASIPILAGLHHQYVRM
jgi:transposase InsO family protein